MPRIRNVDGVRPQPFFVRASQYPMETARALNIFKSNRVLGFEFSIQSSVYGAITVAKVSLFSTWIRSTVSFYSTCMYISIEIDLFRRQ